MTPTDVNTVCRGGTKLDRLALPVPREIPKRQQYLVFVLERHLFVIAGKNIRDLKRYHKDIMRMTKALGHDLLIGDIYYDKTDKGITYPIMVLHDEIDDFMLNSIRHDSYLQKLVDRAFPSVKIYSYDFEELY